MYYQDWDHDTYGNANQPLISCEPVEGYVTNSDDCNDRFSSITTGNEYYKDLDNDGFGNPNFIEIACNLPEGFVSNNDDCDDSWSNITDGGSTIITEGCCVSRYSGGESSDL